MTNAIQPFHLLIIALAGWLNRRTHHLTTVNFGNSGLSNKSIVCLKRSFFTNAAYAFSVVLTEA
jgi:hypothetical protein